MYIVLGIFMFLFVGACVAPVCVYLDIQRLSIDIRKIRQKLDMEE